MTALSCSPASCRPRRRSATAAVAALAQEARAVVLLEAPHRIEALARSLAALGARPVTVGRELTKQFEEIATCPAASCRPG